MFTFITLYWLCYSPGPREFPGCTGTCQLTYCRACYFAPEPLPRPGSCTQCDRMDYQSDTRCFRRWSKCIRKAHRKENRWVKFIYVLFAKSCLVGMERNVMEELALVLDIRLQKTVVCYTYSSKKVMSLVL